MKKFLSALTAAIMLFSLCCVNAFAAEKINISASTASEDRGNEITVTLSLDNVDAGIGGATVYFKWDDAVLDYVTHGGSTVPSTVMTNLVTLQPDGKSLCWLFLNGMDRTANLTGDATIATVTFEILDSAAYGDSSISVEVTQLYRNNNVAVNLVAGTDYTLTNGKVTVVCGSHVFDTTAPKVWKGGVAPTCTVGATQILTCEKCGDETEKAVDALGHGTITHYPANSVTCASGGNVEYWICSNEPGVYYTTNNNGVLSGATTSIATGALNHKNVSKVGEVAATCTEDGVKEHYSCPDCGMKFTDATLSAEATAEDLKIAKTNHPNAVETPYKDSTCTEEGTFGYWTCPDCGKIYADSEFTIETTVENEVMDATGHYIVWTTTKEATETENGEKKGTCENVGCTLPEQTIATGKLITKLPSENIVGDDKAALEGVGDQKLNEDVYFAVADATEETMGQLTDEEIAEAEKELADALGTTADKTKIISLIGTTLQEMYLDGQGNLLSTDMFDLDGKVKTTISMPAKASDYTDLILVYLDVYNEEFVKVEYTDNGDGTISFESDSSLGIYALVGTEIVKTPEGTPGGTSGEANPGTGVGLPVVAGCLLIASLAVAVVLKKKVLVK